MAVAAAVAMVILLALKAPLHAWLRQLAWTEVRAVLILLAMTFLLLPILPNRPIDPWQAINPAEIWLLAILIAGVSFAGYVATRTMGDQTGIARHGDCRRHDVIDGHHVELSATGAGAAASRRLCSPAAFSLPASTMIVRVVLIVGRSGSSSPDPTMATGFGRGDRAARRQRRPDLARSRTAKSPARRYG